MNYCILCNDLADKRYNIKLKDKLLDILARGHLCRECFKKLMESHGFSSVE
ncbi:MAG: hypothetical protein ISS36_01180 [Candidatus Aenigmarchaeota archaeon]|nr:hypothetical protein [Candidatus Aenigmarchaeota archaeon]